MTTTSTDYYYYHYYHRHTTTTTTTTSRTIYDKVPLVDVEEFLETAPVERTQAQQENPHQFMLQRLEYELEQRKKYEYAAWCGVV